MTVKALRKQLFAAIAMVVVSAVALSSSTYAWFAANNKVSATGMQVQATAEGGIEIAYSSSSETSASYTTSASANATEASALAPISTLDTTAWYHASAKLASASTARPETYETLTLTETGISGQAFGKLGGVTVDSTTTNYYMVQNFNIRSTSSTSPAKGLSVDRVSVAASSFNMNEALRVAVVLPNVKTLIYDPIANDQTPYAVYSGFTGSGSDGDPYTAKLAGNVTCNDATTKNLLAANETDNIPAKGNGVNGGVDVKVYIWFEGEDAKLYSDNFNTQGLTVTVDFSATTGTTNNSQGQTPSAEPSTQSDNEASGEAGTVDNQTAVTDPTQVSEPGAM